MAPTDESDQGQANREWARLFFDLDPDRGGTHVYVSRLDGPQTSVAGPDKYPFYIVFRLAARSNVTVVSYLLNERVATKRGLGSQSKPIDQIRSRVIGDSPEWVHVGERPENPDFSVKRGASPSVLKLPEALASSIVDAHQRLHNLDAPSSGIGLG